MRTARQPQTPAPGRKHRGIRRTRSIRSLLGFTVFRGPRRLRPRAALVAGTACALVLAAGPFPAQAEDGVPTPDTLREALLEPLDLGPDVEQSEPSPDDDGTGPTGCAALDDLRGSRTQDTADPWPEVQLSAGSVVIQQKLTAGPPESIAAGHAAIRDALTSCTTLTFPGSDGGPPLTLNLSPVSFGGPDAVALRMDGTYAGVSVNGYLALEPLGAVELLYVFFQAGGDSTEAAAAVYAMAVDKIHLIVGPAAGPPQPLATPIPGTTI
ncbi:hypothetical protein [Yinghuangia sp. YIM S09857]|uniref:hypothetical protein n=1 Tax=Yinghuangia sp. YIM S09857 TaxID=3436929 RepID=UPI003F52DB57